MLVNIQRDSQAVLAAATDCLQSAIQQHHHYHRSRDQDSGRVALLQQHLEKLRASMASLHSHLKHWREVRFGGPWAACRCVCVGLYARFAGFHNLKLCDLPCVAVTLHTAL